MSFIGKKSRVLAGLLAGFVAVGFIASSAQAIAPNTGYATYTAAVPNGAAGSVAMTAGFGDITYTSTGSSSVTIPGGSSAIQTTATPFGAFVGLTSANQQYINTKMTSSATAVNTYTFGSPTPNNGKWAFSLGDIDAETIVVTGTLANGSPATAAQLGIQPQYNYNNPGSGATPLVITQVGNSVTIDDPACTPSSAAGTCDTVGIAAWFTPSASLSSLTITATGKQGFPVYQTWFATQYKKISGGVDVNPANPPTSQTLIPPISLDLIDNSTGLVVAETTSSTTDGSWNFPAVYPDEAYTIVPTGPNGEDLPDIAIPAMTADYVVTPDIVAPPEVIVDGTVTNLQGDPAAFDVQVIDQNGTVINQTDVQPDGTFSFPFMTPSATLELVVVASSGEVSQATPLNTVAGDVTGVALIAPSLLAKTGAQNPSWLLIPAGVLLLAGVGAMLVVRRRNTSSK